MISSARSWSPEVTLRHKLLAWLPTVLWLCLLAMFSTDTFSAEHTGSILWKIVHAVYSGITERQFELLHFFVRKAAHFTFYGLLGVWAFYGWRATLPAPKRWSLRWSALAVMVTFLAGSLDEFHQSFVPSRTATPRDVLLDTAGAVFLQVLLALMILRRVRHRERRAGSPSLAK